MCLVVVAFNCRDCLPLVVAANRDEFHARPTGAAQWWADRPDVVGGRDLEAGGTWLAMHRNGRVACVTNYRDAKHERAGYRSRGELVTGFVDADMPPAEYLAGIDAGAYAGFNLLVADRERMAYLSNRGAGLRELEPGIYGLSNATLDEPWSKVQRSKARLEATLESGNVDEDGLFELLSDRRKGPRGESQTDGLTPEFAHTLTAPFIVAPEYGTRSSTVLIVDSSGRVRFVERRFDAGGDSTGESKFEFELRAEHRA